MLTKLIESIKDGSLLKTLFIVGCFLFFGLVVWVFFFPSMSR